MKHVKILLFIISFNVFYACKDPREYFRDTPQNIMVVLCDITKSLDTSSINKVKENALKILNKYPEAEIYFFPIDSNLYTNPLLGKKSYKNMRYSEKSASEKKDVETLKINIEQTYRNRNTRASCIIKGFTMAANKFKEFKPKENYKFKLIFLSDMLEYCFYEPGKINLENKAQYKKALDVLQKLPTPEMPLSSLPVEITFVITAHKQLPIDENLHKEFWKAVCQKHGYEEQVFQSFNFGSSLPENL